MDLKKLKKLIDSDKERLIVVEDGEPSYVIMDFDEYQRMKGVPEQRALIKESSEEPEKRPEERREPVEEAEPKPEAELTVEDLPF